MFILEKVTVSLTEQNYNLQSKAGRFIRVMVSGNTRATGLVSANLNLWLQGLI